MSGRFRRRFGSRRSRYSRSGFRSRWSSSARRARGNQRAANQQNDISNVTVNIMKKVKTGVIGVRLGNKDCEVGTAVINIFELLNKSDFYQSYSNMYDQFRINRIQVKATPVTWKTYNQYNLPNAIGGEGSTGGPVYSGGAGGASIDNVPLADAPTYIVPQALTIVTAWDRTGLDPSQLAELGDYVYSTIGDNIASYSSAKSSQLVAGASFNCVRYLYPTSQQEKSLYFSTSDLVKQIDVPVDNQKWFAMRKAEGFSSERITNLMSDPNCPFKPTFMIGVLKVDDITYPALGEAANCKNQISPVTFNLEFDIGVTFRGLRKTQIVYNEEDIEELLEDLYYPELTDNPNYNGQEAIDFENESGEIEIKYIKPITQNTLPNEPLIIEPSSDEYMGIDQVHLEINVPQNISNVVQFVDNPQDVTQSGPWKQNGTFSIDDWKNNPNNNLSAEVKDTFVGFNPVIVDVPNSVLSEGYVKEGNNIRINDSFIANGIYTINECRDVIPYQNTKDKFVGFNPVVINVPNKVTDKAYEINDQQQVVQTNEFKENGVYSIEDMKLTLPVNERDQYVGFSSVSVNVPNEALNAATESTTFRSNGTFNINDYNSSNNTNYVGFNPVKIEVQPKLLTGETINIPNNNYTLNINSWNNEHPDNLKDGFNNIIIHYNEEGGSQPIPDNKVAENQVVSSITSNINTLITNQQVEGERKDYLFKEFIISNNKLTEMLGRQIEYTNNVHALIATNQIGGTTTNNSLTVNGHFLTTGNNGAPQKNFLTSDFVPNNALPEGYSNQQLIAQDSFSIKALEAPEQSSNQLALEYYNNENVNSDPNYDPTQPQQRLLKKMKMSLRGEDKPFSVVPYYTKYIDSIMNYNTTFGTDYYAFISQKKQVEIEMLEYDKIVLNNNDLGTVVQYDIEDDFIFDQEKNPTYSYHPLGLRKLNIDLTGVTGGSTINNYNPYPNGSPLQISSNGSGNITFDASTYTGLSNIYYNVTVLPNLYNGYVNNPYQITSTSGTINVPQGSDGLSSVSYNVNISGYGQINNYLDYNSMNPYNIISKNGVISVPVGYTGLADINYSVNTSDINVNNMITSRNGTYTVPSGSVGFNSFTVNVPTDVDNADIDSNNGNVIISRTGTYNVPSGKTGWNSFSVNVPSDVDNDNVDIQNNNIITSRTGTYNVPNGKTGWNSFSVNIPSDVDNADVNNQNNNIITSNGTFNIPNGKTGWNSFSVNVENTSIKLTGYSFKSMGPKYFNDINGPYHDGSSYLTIPLESKTSTYNYLCVFQILCNANRTFINTYNYGITCFRYDGYNGSEVRITTDFSNSTNNGHSWYHYTFYHGSSAISSSYSYFIFHNTNGYMGNEQQKVVAVGAISDTNLSNDNIIMFNGQTYKNSGGTTIGGQTYIRDEYMNGLPKDFFVRLPNDNLIEK